MSQSPAVTSFFTDPFLTEPLLRRYSDDFTLCEGTDVLNMDYIHVEPVEFAEAK